MQNKIFRSRRMLEMSMSWGMWTNFCSPWRVINGVSSELSNSSKFGTVNTQDANGKCTKVHTYSAIIRV